MAKGINTATTFASLVGTIMETPIEAVTRGEHAYLRIWLHRLEAIKQWLASSDNAQLSDAEFREMLRYVPTLSLIGEINVAATVRLASVRQIDGSIGLSVGAGPIGIGGSFGYSSRQSEESVIQISATFKINNGEANLFEYLKNNNPALESVGAGDLDAAIGTLKDRMTTIETAKELSENTAE
ncbi:MAG: hypothetical protein AAFR38_06435 [Planctomycetota bacterium]